MKENDQLDLNSPKLRPVQEKLHVFLLALHPYLKRIWKRRKQFMWFNGVATVAALLFALFAGHEYTTTLEILPDYGNKSSLLSGLGGLSEIASFAGINLGGETSTDIYQDLLSSETVLAPVVYNEYTTEKYDHKVNLVEYFNLKSAGWLPDSLQERYKLLQVMKNLTKKLRTEVDRETKILTLELRMPEGRLAADILNKIAESLDNYVRTQRKSHAVNQRIYIEKRLEQVKDSLRTAEETLANFRVHNRILDISPQLQLEQTRLTRAVEIQQTVYMELMRQIELAKIEEIRDTPILNIKEYSQNPIVPTSLGHRYQFAILVLFFLTASGCYFAFEEDLKGIWLIAKEEAIGIYRQVKS